MSNAEAVIEGDCIVIRVPLDCLPEAVSGYCGMDFGNSPMVVTDARAFANGVCHALAEEDHGGVSRVHRLFDAAFESAFEGASEGVEEGVRCEACSHTFLKADATYDEEDGVWICKPCGKTMQGEVKP